MSKNRPVLRPKSGAGQDAEGLIRAGRGGRLPGRNIDVEEYATLEWVDWFNNRRLLEPIGYVPPAEYEQEYYRNQEAEALAA